METFELRELSFAYPGQARGALTDVTLSVGQGEFLLICGSSGSGKSTLLRQLKTVLAPEGRRSGEVLFQGRPLSGVDRRTQSQSIGFVQQSPENQIVTDKVWHELAFGLESLGLETGAIRRRVAEMAGFFGIEDWFYRDVSELSGGQKQLLSLASVMVMQPSALILDEPTAQLDPIAAGDFFAALGRINRELGTTVILSEQRLEEAFPLCTRVAVLDGGRLLFAGTPEEAGPAVRDAGSSMLLALPAPARVWCAADSGGGPCPVSVREGREWLAEFCRTHEARPLPPEPERRYSGETAIEARQLWFRYEKEQPDVVRGLSLRVRRGEFLAVLGGNGAGKTTSLMLLAGILRPYRGEVERHGSVGVLPQGAQALFVKKTVREDLLEIIPKSDEEREARMAHIAALCRLGALLERHPYDLSGGEQQRAALAKVLLTGPDILLLDEPTKGLDAEFKRSLAEILRALLERGVTVVMVSHDVEFCARYAHRCALFFDGGIVAEGTPGSFFAGNSFYTTAANRMARGILTGAVTAEDIIACCGGEVPEAEELPEELPPMPPEECGGIAGRAGERLSRTRRLGAVLSGGAALALFLHLVRAVDLSAVLDFGGAMWRQAVQYFAFFAALFVFALCVTRRGAERSKESPARKRRLGRRSAAAAGLILLMIPLTLFAGVFWLGGGRYYFISLLVIFEAMLPFFLMFEGRRPQARELVIIAALCAISVAGRAAFFMLPQFKPVLAMTVIVGAALGGETGFLVGAMTMLASNIFFSQGPWTPWQMFAMGIIGFLAGLLFHAGPVPRTRGSLCVFGALSAVVIYGGIMNSSSALMWVRELDWKMMAAYYASGFPMDCVHGAGTALFLWLAAGPMLEKLERIKVKYGLDE